LKPGDVVVGVLVGAQETKVRPAVVIASATYLAERPDAVVGILTTKLPRSECRITLKFVVKAPTTCATRLGPLVRKTPFSSKGVFLKSAFWWPALQARFGYLIAAFAVCHTCTGRDYASFIAAS